MGSPREVHASEITRVVRELCIEINYTVPPEMVELMQRAREKEESPLGRQVLDLLIRNQELAAEGEYPYCQDTGYTVVFLDLGQDVHVTGGDLYAAIDEGVRRGYTDGYLRGSIVRDPLFDRKNTGDNTPAFVHTRIVPGDQIRIQIDAKGAGSENMGRHAMLKPADGIEGVKHFVLQAVAESGPNACPPGIIGVGVGGNFELSAVLAKKALMRKVGQPNPDPQIADLEAELYEKCNALGLGPEALGGTQTVLAVHVETMATHIASLPVAVNIECHAHRTGTRVI
jgi:fumarate hydratase subunit alpha